MTYMRRFVENQGLKALGYVEVLISMVIISIVFTAFLVIAYRAVYRAKILESKDLMENYAITLLEKYDSEVHKDNAWGTGTYLLQLDTGTGDITIIAQPACTLSSSTKLLSEECGNVSDILPGADSRFGYRITSELDTGIGTNSIYNIVVTVGCKATTGGESCDPKQLPPIEIKRSLVNYAGT